MISAGQIHQYVQGDMPLAERAFLNELLLFTLHGPNRRVFAGIDRDTVLTLLAWHAHKDTMVISRTEDGGLNGLLLWYRTNGQWTMKDLNEWRKDDPGGANILFAAAIANGPGVMKEGLWKFFRKVPDAIDLNFQAVREKGGRKRIINYPRRLIIKLLKGVNNEL